MDELTTVNNDPKYKYRESIRKANRKYRQTHPERCRAIQHAHYQRHKDETEFRQGTRDRAKTYYDKMKSDPEFMKLKCQRAKERYWRLKELNQDDKANQKIINEIFSKADVKDSAQGSAQGPAGTAFAEEVIEEEIEDIKFN